jgi:hypothetical protein
MRKPLRPPAIVACSIGMLFCPSSRARAECGYHLRSGREQIVGVARQPDRKMIVGGGFTGLGGWADDSQPHRRLNVNGTVDAAVAGATDLSSRGGGCRRMGDPGRRSFRAARRRARQPQRASKPSRIRADVRSTPANPGTEWDLRRVWALAFQADGKILVSGGSTLAAPRNSIGRSTRRFRSTPLQSGHDQAVGRPIVTILIAAGRAV